MSVFGVKGRNELGVTVFADTLSVSPLFGWSFWVAVGAAGMAMLSSSLFLCVGRRDDV